MRACVCVCVKICLPAEVEPTSFTGLDMEARNFSATMLAMASRDSCVKGCEGPGGSPADFPLPAVFVKLSLSSSLIGVIRPS